MEVPRGFTATESAPLLEFTCMICQVTISHPDDPDKVLKVAAHHNAVMHVQAVRLGDWRIEWLHPVMEAVTDKLDTAVRSRFDDQRLDVWADQFGIEFSFWDIQAPIEDVLEVVATHVGPELRVIDRWRVA